MCGIAALLAVEGWNCSAPPWEGAIVSAGALPSREQLALSISARGPDAQRSVSGQLLSADARFLPDGLHLFGSTLCLRGPPTEQPLVDAAGNVLLFNGELFVGENVDVSDRTNDTAQLLALLADADDNLNSVPALMASLRGPYAIIFWQSSTGRLWFGRDPLGRHSLLVQVCQGEGLALTSTAPQGYDFQELPPFGWCSVDFDDVKAPHIKCHWRPSTWIPALNDVPGGPPPPLAAINALPEIFRRPLDPGRSPHFEDTGTEVIDVALLSDTFRSLLMYATERRLVGLRSSPLSAPQTPPGHTKDQNPAKVAVLFSGGIDSLAVARLVDLCLALAEPVDLINVSFGPPPFESPDRSTSLEAVRELGSLSQRVWRLIAVNITPAEIDLHRHRISALIHPACTPMDASLATALWFAARGRGTCYSSDGNTITDDFTTSAKVLFSGLGADEQLAGYKGRHRTVFRKGGVGALARELEADVSRLWWRNLGRDDRVVGDHGRELRFPFLDEDVVSFLASVPLKHLCDLSLEDGVGDKRLLRTMARTHLQLSERACSRVKRAMQFGSRSKKYVENDKSERAIGSRKNRRAAARRRAAGNTENEVSS